MNHSLIDILFMRPSIIIINYNTQGCSARCEPNSRLGGIYSNFDTLWVYADRSDPKIDSLICNACVLSGDEFRFIQKSWWWGKSQDIQRWNTLSQNSSSHSYNLNLFNQKRHNFLLVSCKAWTTLNTIDNCLICF